jgi:hypothetical protein
MRVAWRERRIDLRSVSTLNAQRQKVSRANAADGTGKKVARLMLFTCASDEYNEAMGGCNDIASLKAWVVHGPLVCSFGVLLVGWRRARHPRVGDKFLRPATRTLYAFLLLFSRQRGVGEALRFLRETVSR